MTDQQKFQIASALLASVKFNSAVMDALNTVMRSSAFANEAEMVERVHAVTEAFEAQLKATEEYING